MTSFVLHTKNRKDREKLFTQELENQKFTDYNVIEGRFDPLRSLTAISDVHKEAVKCGICSNSPHILIMENDVMFTAPGALNRFIELVDQLPQDWDIFLAGISSGKIEPVNPQIARCTKFTGFFCYIVRAKFYEKFLTADPDANIDYWMGINSDCKAYCAQPMLAITHSGYSDNVKRIVNYTKYFNVFKLWDPKNN